MRSSAQITRTPGEYREAQDAERAIIRRELAAALRLADQRDESWYEWLLARSERRHDHTLRDGEGRAVACPFPGCAAVSASTSSAPQLDASSAIADEPRESQMELIA